jgi:competence protein ComEC
MNVSVKSFIVFIFFFTLSVLFLAIDTSKFKEDGLLHIYVLDIGQGDSSLIQTPTGELILIDAGPDPLLLQQQLEKILPWYTRSIDMLVISHYHQDHFAGYVDLFKKYPPRIVFLPPHLAKSYVGKWISQLSETSDIVFAMSQRDWLYTGLFIDTLLPVRASSARVYKNINNGSIVQQLVYGDFEMLFMGDIEEEGIRVLTDLYGEQLQSDIMKASHHGSENGWTHTLYRLVQPAFVTISSGLNNTYNHPHEVTLRKLQKESIPYKNTAEFGMIHIVSDGKTFWIE